MEDTYLVQRLKQPTGHINPFSFGGGGGGMTKEAREVLDKIWSWDYMGAAEFEFGAVPKAFGKMDGKELVASFLKVSYKYFFNGWRDAPEQTFEGKKQVFYICIKEHEDEVKARLKKWAKAEPRNTKERIRFNEGLADMPKEIDSGIVGWFELDNGFFFFADEKMWRSACEILEIKVPSKKKVSKG